MSKKMRVFVSSRSFGKLSEEPLKILEHAAEIKKSTFGRPLKENDLVKILPLYDGIIVGTDEVTRRAIESSDRLKVIAKHGAGVDNIDLQAATEKGVVVTYVPGVNAEAVADFTFCLTLALARNLTDAHASARSGKWEATKFLGTELYKKTLGIIGMGTVGKAVARRATGFNMKILCHTAHPEKHREETKKWNVEYVDLDTLLKESDFVTIHCVLTPETEGLINEQKLALMKKTAFLINTARGPIVNEKAVYTALKEKRIAGAGFDVYSKEPPGADCPLFQLDNVVVAPHIASYTREAVLNVDLVQARDVVKALRGEKPEFVANPEVLKK